MSMIPSSRGQTSIEVLLVVAFVLVVSLAVVTPYVGNQHITNASLMTKLSILPFVEKNGLPVKISHIQPEVDRGGILMNIDTVGKWDESVRVQLIPLSGPAYGCVFVCSEISKVGAYSPITVRWLHNGVAFCGHTC